MKKSTRFICGLAIPYSDSPAWIVDAGHFERFQPGAFAKQISNRSPVSLVWDSHDADAARLASTRDRSLYLFEDEAGLWFRAAIDDDANRWRLAAMVRGRDPISYASIGGLQVGVKGTCLHLGSHCDVVLRAEIDHIAIVDKPAYRETGVWPDGEDLAAAPFRIQELAAKFENAWSSAARMASTKNTVSADLRSQIPSSFTVKLSGGRRARIPMRQEIVLAIARGLRSHHQGPVGVFGMPRQYFEAAMALRRGRGESNL